MAAAAAGAGSFSAVNAALWASAKISQSWYDERWKNIWKPDELIMLVSDCAAGIDAAIKGKNKVRSAAVSKGEKQDMDAKADDDTGLWDFQHPSLLAHPGKTDTKIPGYVNDSVRYGSMRINLDTFPLPSENDKAQAIKVGMPLASNDRGTAKYYHARNKVLNSLEQELIGGSGDILMNLNFKALNNSMADAPPFAFALGCMRKGMIPELLKCWDTVPKHFSILRDPTKLTDADYQLFTCIKSFPAKLMRKEYIISVAIEIPTCALFGPNEVLFWGIDSAKKNGGGAESEGKNAPPSALSRFKRILNAAQGADGIYLCAFEATRLLADIRKKIDQLASAWGVAAHLIIDGDEMSDISAMFSQFRGPLMELNYREVSFLHDMSASRSVKSGSSTTTSLHHAIADGIKCLKKIKESSDDLLVGHGFRETFEQALSAIGGFKHGGQSAFGFAVRERLLRVLMNYAKTEDCVNDVRLQFMELNMMTMQVLIQFVELLERGYLEDKKINFFFSL